MGVPNFFSYIRNRGMFRSAVRSYLNKVNIFCLDVNGIIHSEAAKVFGGKAADIISRDDYIIMKKKLFNSIVLAILQLCKTVRPTEVLYIAIDGVAPQAKINQQRSRRYKSSQTKVEGQLFDGVSITPGTDFMIELDAFLKITFDGIMNRNGDMMFAPFYQFVPAILYSSHMEKGEGEHKIADYLRSIDNTKNKHVLVHGMDADLIMIYMMILVQKGYRNISLFRENNDDYTIKTIIDLYQLSENITSVYRRPAVKEFVFILYLFGNDFLPRFPELELSHQALDALIFGYQTYILRGDPPVMMNGDIHWQGVSQFLTYFVENHADKLLKDVAVSSQIPHQYNIINNASMGGDLNVSQFRSLWFDRIFTPRSMDVLRAASPEDKQLMCIEYLSGLTWVFNYYNRGVSSVNPRWYYPYHYTPDLKYLTRFLENEVNSFAVWERAAIHVLSSYPSVIEQLCSVIPPSSISVIPKFLRNIIISPLSPLADLYPVRWLLDPCGKVQPDHEQIALLPIPDSIRVYEITKAMMIPEEYIEKWKSVETQTFVKYITPEQEAAIRYLQNRGRRTSV